MGVAVSDGEMPTPPSVVGAGLALGPTVGVGVGVKLMTVGSSVADGVAETGGAAVEIAVGVTRGAVVD